MKFKAGDILILKSNPNWRLFIIDYDVESSHYRFRWIDEEAKKTKIHKERRASFSIFREENDYIIIRGKLARLFYA